MSSVGQIIEQVQSKSNPGISPRTPQEFVEIHKTSIAVGDRTVFVKAERAGGNFSISFVGVNGRPGFVSGKAQALAEAREGILAAVAAAFDAVCETDEAHKKRVAEKASKGSLGQGEQRPVRSMGKTERERQKKLARKA